LDENAEEKVPISEKSFFRALFRAAHGAKPMEIRRCGRSRASAATLCKAFCGEQKALKPQKVKNKGVHRHALIF